MGAPITPSELRQNIYRLLDHALDTGEPLEIKRKGRTLRLVPVDGPPDRLAAIRTNPGIVVGDTEELVSMDWSGEWDAEEPVHP